MFGTYFCLSSSEPLTSSDATAPCVRPLYISKLWLAEPRYSAIAVATTDGSPCPPYSCGACNVVQPPATNWSQASLKPGGVVTEPSSLRLQPCSSPTRFKGASTSSQKRAPSVRIASTRSGVASAKPGRLE